MKFVDAFRRQKHSDPPRRTIFESSWKVLYFSLLSLSISIFFSFHQLQYTINDLIDGYPNTKTLSH